MIENKRWKKKEEELLGVTNIEYISAAASGSSSDDDFSFGALIVGCVSAFVIYSLYVEIFGEGLGTLLFFLD
ncbi:MAG: hypothetical protein LBB06_01330 [Endomicrobium sp.]|nr:hypothetical protein [Endomicrobium sp.]